MADYLQLANSGNENLKNFIIDVIRIIDICGETRSDFNDLLFCRVGVFTIVNGQAYNIEMGKHFVYPNMLYKQLKYLNFKNKIRVEILPVPQEFS